MHQHGSTPQTWVAVTEARHAATPLVALVQARVYLLDTLFDIGVEHLGTPVVIAQACSDNEPMTQERESLGRTGIPLLRISRQSGCNGQIAGLTALKNTPY